MKIRSARIAGLILCLVVSSQLLAAPPVRMSSLFARWLAYVQSKLSPPLPGSEGRLSPPIPVAHSKISPPIGGAPPSDTEPTTTRVAPRQP